MAIGVQSLYGHLSSLDVKAGDMVRKAQPLGRSGMTGLAGGDHLHFTMLVDGRPVNSVEWWDSHWIEDRVLRKIRDAAAPDSATARARHAEVRRGHERRRGDRGTRGVPGPVRPPAAEGYNSDSTVHARAALYRPRFVRCPCRSNRRLTPHEDRTGRRQPFSRAA